MWVIQSFTLHCCLSNVASPLFLHSFTWAAAENVFVLGATLLVLYKRIKCEAKNEWMNEWLMAHFPPTVMCKCLLQMTIVCFIFSIPSCVCGPVLTWQSNKGIQPLLSLPLWIHLLELQMKSGHRGKMGACTRNERRNTHTTEWCSLSRALSFNMSSLDISNRCRALLVGTGTSVLQCQAKPSGGWRLSMWT